MGDNAAVSISEAARLTGKARQTIYRHIKQGKLSTSIRGDGAQEIQVVDLERLYGPLRGSETAHEATPTLAPGETALQRENDALRAETAHLRARVDELRRDKEWLRGMVDRVTPKALPAPQGFSLARLFGFGGTSNRDQDK